MATKPRSSHVSKKTYRKVKKSMAKTKKSKAKANLDTKFVQCINNYIANPTQGVTVSNYLYAGFPMIYQTSIGSNEQFNFYCQQYDRVRVNKMTVEVVPKANVFDQANAQNDALLTLSGDGLVHTVIDRNSIGPSNKSLMAKYPSYKTYSVMKKFKRSYKVLWPKGVWLNTKETFANQYDTINSIGGNGTITLYCENMVEDVAELFNEPLANIKVTWDCVFSGYSPPALKFGLDASGNKIITMTKQEDVSNFPQSDISAVSGTISDYRNNANDYTAPENTDNFSTP